MHLYGIIMMEIANGFFPLINRKNGGKKGNPNKNMKYNIMCRGILN
jgi:hypothetical protein